MNPTNRQAIRDYGMTSKEYRADRRRTLVKKYIAQGHTRAVALQMAKRSTRGF